ncbi:MAG: orotate phosphoribosyltransferase, partial [Gammaproteobacteria bacterium]
GGLLVGAPLAGRVLIIDDVITAGTAVRESLHIIRQAGATPTGLIIALDRQERGQQGKSAIAELRETEHVEVAAIARLEDIITWLQNRPDLTFALTALQEYRQRYGA